MRKPRIGQQRDVGERGGVADQETRCRQLVLHPRQRRVAALDLVRIEIGRGLAQIHDLETAHRNMGLVAVLFPEQPLVHFRRVERVGRNQIAAAREIADDRIGLGERAAIVELDRRHLARAIELEKLRVARFALQRIDLNPGVGQCELVADPFHLQAIA